jgi:hypothetical protein
LTSSAKRPIPFVQNADRPYSNEPRRRISTLNLNTYAPSAPIQRLYGKHFILKTRQQIFDENWYGYGIPHPSTQEFIGDFVAIATDRSSFDHVHNGTIAHLDMKAHHAGLTEDEMLIDVMALNK